MSCQQPAANEQRSAASVGEYSARCRGLMREQQCAPRSPTGAPMSVESAPATLGPLTPDPSSEDGVDRRGFLTCMAWAGTAVVWSIVGGVPRSAALTTGGKILRG